MHTTTQAQRFLMLLIFSLVFSASCAKKGGDASPEKAVTPGENTEIAPTPIATPVPTTPDVVASKLPGVWEATCEDVTSRGDVNIKGLQISFEINADQIAQTHSFFGDTDCSHLVAKMVTSYVLKTVGAAGPSGEGAQVDFELTDYTITPLTNAVTADYNSREVCGLSDNLWFVYGPRSVTTLECEPMARLYFRSRLAGSTEFQIMRFAESGNQTSLFLGDPRSGNGTSPVARPKAYSTKAFLRR